MINKWQPVMLIATERVECGECHALAIFIVLSEPITPSDEPDKTDMTYAAYCQACFEQAQQQEDEQPQAP